MALTREIDQKIKDFDWNIRDLAEAFCDMEEELNNKIAELEKEMEEHNCESL